MENQKEKYTKRSYDTGPVGLIATATNITTYSIAWNALENYSIFSNVQKDFSKMIAVLGNFNEKNEAIMALKNDYWEIKKLISNPDRMNSTNSWYGIIDGDISDYSAIYDPQETELLLKHLYMNLLREFDYNIPTFSYNEEYEDSSTWAFWEFLKKK